VRSFDPIIEPKEIRRLEVFTGVADDARGRTRTRGGSSPSRLPLERTSRRWRGVMGCGRSRSMPGGGSLNQVGTIPRLVGATWFVVGLRTAWRMGRRTRRHPISGVGNGKHRPPPSPPLPPQCGASKQLPDPNSSFSGSVSTRIAAVLNAAAVLRPARKHLDQPQARSRHRPRCATYEASAALWTRTCVCFPAASFVK
jgi:hypothetical protein